MKQGTTYSRIASFGLFLFAVSLPISHVPTQLGIGVAFLARLSESIRSRNWTFHWHALFLPLVAYIGWNVVAAALSERPDHSLGAVLDNEWPLLIMVSLYWIVESERELGSLVKVFLAASSVAVIYAVWQSVGGVELYRGVRLDPMGWGFYRAVGFYGFYLTFAAFAMTVFLYSSSFALEMKKWPYAVLAGLSFVAVIATFARSIWISLAAAIPLFAFTKGRKAGIVVVGALVVLGVGGILSVPALRNRAESIISPGQNETRLNLWKTAIEMSKDHPVFGVGEDNWDHHFERYRVNGFYDTTVHPHNDYLTVLVSSGIPGLIAFVSTWLVALGGGIRLIRSARTPPIRAIAMASTFSLMGLMIGGLFQNYYGTFVNCLGWWFVVGLLLSAERLDRELKNSVAPAEKGAE
jgi:O-antigen ligase